MEAGPLPYFVRPSGTGSRGSLWRSWKALPRFQRHLLLLLSVLGLLSLAALAYSYRSLGGEESSAEQPRSYDKPRPKPRLPPPATQALHPSFAFTKIRVTLRRAEEGEAAEANESDGNEGEKPPQPQQIAQPRNLHFKGPENERQRAVVEAMRHAWKNYKAYAWGKDQLRPLTKSYQEWFGLGLTILDSLDTLLIMGLEEEFKEARDWVAANLDFSKARYVSLFETTIRCLGGLLSAFHLSGDEMFLEKAKDLGYRLAGAFNSPSRVPYSDVNLATKAGKQPAWGAESSLAEFTTIQLEFRDLSRATGIRLFEELAFNVSAHVHRKGCEDGLCPMFMSPKTGEWQKSSTLTFGARSDTYYEYLLKQWLQTGKKIPWLREDYAQAMKGMESKLVRFSEPNKLTFVGELIGGKTYSPKMDHLACFIAGTLALGTTLGFPKEHLDLAKAIGHTCHEMYRNPTGLGPEIAHFNMVPGKEDLYVKPLDAHCLLRPEAIEAWFYLRRIGGEQLYADWGWEAFKAIEKFARVPHGYASVNSVKKIPVQHRDLMETFFLGETLKYLYLLFSDSQEDLPLHQWVFNTEAHPLPVRDS